MILSQEGSLDEGSANSAANGGPGANSGDDAASGGRPSVRILVVECDDALREGCIGVLRTEGYTVAGVSQGEEALRIVTRRQFDIILVNLFMSGVSGMKILEAAKAAYPKTIIVLMTGNPSVETNIRALQAGAWEYLAMPFTAEQLQLVAGRAAHEVLASRRNTLIIADRSPGQPEFVLGSDALIGISPAFREVVDLAQRVARTNASVMITGESGTGKEGIAQLIHKQSRRAAKRFVAINCAALPAPLLESEMFGHKKGAFTGADRDKPGLLEVAHQGTLFLDELTEMPLALQAKLLRVLQDGIVRRVGSEQEDATVDVRFVSATNRDPEEAINQQLLRNDIFYRLRVIPIHLPPLRERREDIPLLANHFLAQYWRRHRNGEGPLPHLTPSAIDYLVSRSWPGNVRELQNAIEHLAVLADPGSAIEADQLPMRTEIGHGSLTHNGWPRDIMAQSYHDAKEAVLAQFEREYLSVLVTRANRNMSKAARLAGIDRTTLYRLLEKHNSTGSTSQDDESTPAIPGDARRPAPADSRQ